jgi:hypothetical protein
MMKMMLTFEGQDVETMDREQLAAAVKFLFADNERLRREVERLHRNQVDSFRQLAGLSQKINANRFG